MLAKRKKDSTRKCNHTLHSRLFSGSSPSSFNKMLSCSLIGILLEHDSLCIHQYTSLWGGAPRRCGCLILICLRLHVAKSRVVLPSITFEDSVTGSMKITFCVRILIWKQNECSISMSENIQRMRKRMGDDLPIFHLPIISPLPRAIVFLPHWNTFVQRGRILTRPDEHAVRVMRLFFNRLLFPFFFFPLPIFFSTSGL